MIRFTVPTVPVAQPRQRHKIVKTATRTFASNYTPVDDPVNLFKAAVQSAFSNATKQPPVDGPVRLEATFVMPRPQNITWKTRPNPRCHHAKRPDLDNLLKSLKDALSGLAWRDDSQVCEVAALKVVASGEEQPHAEVAIMEAASMEA